MNKDAIRKTAIGYWDNESQCYVVRSPLFLRVMGADETPEGAWKIFDEILEDTYEAYKAGRLAGHSKTGRPSKGRVRTNIELAPDIKQALAAMASTIGISQGEVVDYCISFYKLFGAHPKL